MSSNYGSDIDPDEVCATGESNSTATTQCAPVAPRTALTPRDANIPTTPPSSIARIQCFPPSSSQSVLQKYTSNTDNSKSPAASVSTAPCRFNFGQHREKAFDEVPEHYIRWLKEKEVPKDRIDLRDALGNGSANGRRGSL
ncbi:hypothetical protein CC80DRAFT_558710 [Byssothecium circinans]|uniref:Uncharacterized protein n=1 Tax=Byssothecium circinans TaxID=147558 RepID=A0A6A5T7J8_9PLEO|nr:hypothetical protein CC80DRAFT_558735 [Byssothecium circinans]KAF1948124.1 hypothetical protein CC80DRAFT_558710 [Byssothecium circinans]